MLFIYFQKVLLSSFWEICQLVELFVKNILDPIPS
jgi:hypothetical protein